MSDIAARIDNLLAERKLKRSDLRNATGIPESTMRSWRNGRSPSIEVACQIALFFNISLDYLINGKETEKYDISHITNTEIEIINLFRILDDRDQTDVYDILKAKASHYSNVRGLNTITG